MALRVCRHYDSQSISAMITQLAGAANAAGLTVPPPPTTLAATGATGADEPQEGEPIHPEAEAEHDPDDENEHGHARRGTHRRSHR